MAIPDYQTVMLPLLQATKDGRDHALSDIIDELGNQFGMTAEEKKELLPSGTQNTFDNRVRWAGTYLFKAGLLDRTGRGVIRITGRGLDVLKENPTRIDVKFLRRFPEFRDFQQASRKADTEQKIEEEEKSETPEEMLESSYQSLRRTLAQELLQRVKKCSPRFFENLVVDLLVAMGYGGSRKDAGQAIGQTGDGGIDGIIKEDRLGLDIVYIQAKRWDSTVGAPIVRGFSGSLDAQRARKGVLITTGKFSQDARDFVNRIEKKIVLIDGEELAQFMIDHGIGVSEVATYTVRKADLDYFEEE